MRGSKSNSYLPTINAIAKKYILYRARMNKSLKIYMTLCSFIRIFTKEDTKANKNVEFIHAFTFYDTCV